MKHTNCSPPALVAQLADRAAAPLQSSEPALIINGTSQNLVIGGTHGHKTAFEVTPLQLVDNSAIQNRAGRAYGITECDRAAADIDLVAVETEIPVDFLGESGR